MTKLFCALLLAGALAGCQSASGDGSSVGSGASEFGRSLGTRFGSSTDTLGTQRRMDVYGGATAPVLPTAGIGR